jgi:amino acid transporter
MFIGWENGPALAEECRDPKRTVPRALYASIAIGVALFVFLAYATVTGFHYDVTSIGRSSVPFLTVADHYLGGARDLGLGCRDRLGARDPGLRRELAGADAL